jgi:cap2 methyltransferase
MSDDDPLQKLIKEYSIPSGKEPRPVAISLSDIPSELEYSPNAGFPKTGIHLGQRKLMLSEIEFLTRFGSAASVVVYAGAAPGLKSYLLSELFPSLKFVLVDPANFRVVVNSGGRVFTRRSPEHDEIEYIDEIDTEYISRSRKKVFLFQSCFTDAEARKFASESGVLFVSDIRTNSRDTQFPGDGQILWNLSQQFNWVQIISPVASMVKFRPPFYETSVSELTNSLSSQMAADFELSKQFGIDFLSDFGNEVFRYLAGDVRLQCWEGKSSTETRLWLLPDSQIEIYDHKSHESKLHFYNSVYRTHTLHDNPITSRRLGVDRCNDCAKEMKILSDYAGSDSSRCLELSSRIASYCKGGKNSSNHVSRRHGNVFNVRAILSNIKNDLVERQNPDEYNKKYN